MIVNECCFKQIEKQQDKEMDKNIKRRMERADELIKERCGFGQLGKPETGRWCEDEAYRLKIEREIADLFRTPKEDRDGDPKVCARLDNLNDHEIEALNLGYVGDHEWPYWPTWYESRWHVTTEDLEKNITRMLVWVHERNQKEEKHKRFLAWIDAGRPGRFEDFKPSVTAAPIAEAPSAQSKVKTTDRWRKDWELSGTEDDYDYWVHHYAPSTLVGGNSDGNEVCSVCEYDFPEDTLMWCKHREHFCRPDCSMWYVNPDGGNMNEEERNAVDFPPEGDAKWEWNINSGWNWNNVEQKLTVTSNLDAMADTIVKKVKSLKETKSTCGAPTEQESKPALTRHQKIIQQIEQLDSGIKYWTLSGKPRVRALEKLLGFDITCRERNVAWKKLKKSRRRKNVKS